MKRRPTGRAKRSVLSAYRRDSNGGAAAGTAPTGDSTEATAAGGNSSPNTVRSSPAGVSSSISPNNNSACSTSSVISHTSNNEYRPSDDLDVQSINSSNSCTGGLYGENDSYYDSENDDNASFLSSSSKYDKCGYDPSSTNRLSSTSLSSSIASRLSSTIFFSSFVGGSRKRRGGGTNASVLPLTSSPMPSSSMNAINGSFSSTKDHPCSPHHRTPTNPSTHHHVILQKHHQHRRTPGVRRGHPDFVLSHDQKMLFVKIVGMIVVISFALVYTRSVHVDHLQEMQYQKQQKNQQKILASIKRMNQSNMETSMLKSINNRRLLRPIHLPYYNPSLLPPTTDMLHRFLTFEHQQQMEQLHLGTTTIPNELPLLHIIKTRFMQEQANLTALGEARLALFKIFCLPTIQEQTTQNFIWIIRTDPDLHPLILQQLVDAILGSSITRNQERSKNTFMGNRAKSIDTDDEKELYFRGNIYIVGSNINYRVISNEGHMNVTTPGGWRDGVEPRELAGFHTPNTKVYTGNRTVLEWYMALESKLPLLETRLDADDGLHVSFIHTVQQKAYEQFYETTDLRENNYNKNDNNIYQGSLPTPTQVRWLYWCSRRHIEWHWTDPDYNFVPFGDDSSNKGDSLSQMIATYGAIQGVQHKELCITPGITTGYNIGTPESTVPVYSHDELYKKIVSGKELAHNRCGVTKRNSECVEFIETFAFEAIRSRTPTSAGMLRIDPDLNELKEQHLWWVTYVFWNMLHDSFGVGVGSNIGSFRTGAGPTRIALAWINKYLSNHLLEIVTDNIQGQCTTGHSCKETARAGLKKLHDQASARNQQRQKEQEHQFQQRQQQQAI